MSPIGNPNVAAPLVLRANSADRADPSGSGCGLQRSSPSAESCSSISSRYSVKFSGGDPACEQLGWPACYIPHPAFLMFELYRQFLTAAAAVGSAGVQANVGFARELGERLSTRAQIAFRLTLSSSFAALSFRSLYRSVRYGATSRVSNVNFISSSITSTTRS
jgi:hypothetical protein